MDVKNSGDGAARRRFMPRQVIVALTQELARSPSLRNVWIDFATFLRAIPSSWRLCRLNQNFALVPSKWAKCNAVSPVMTRCPFKMLVMRLVGTSRLRANVAAPSYC